MRRVQRAKPECPARRPASLQDLLWVGVRGTDPYGEMQGRPPVVEPGPTDHGRAIDALACDRGLRCEVRVRGADATTVIDRDRGVTHHHAGERHRPRTGRPHRGPSSYLDIDPPVAGEAADGSEGADDRPFDRRGQTTAATRCQRPDQDRQGERAHPASMRLAVAAPPYLVAGTLRRDKTASGAPVGDRSGTWWRRRPGVRRPGGSVRWQRAREQSPAARWGGTAW